MAWVSAVWSERAPRRTMQRAWMQGQLTVSRALRPVAAAGGAAGSFLASIKRVGWSSPAPNAVVTIDGTVLRRDVEAPRLVARFLLDDYQITTASASGAVEFAAVPVVRGHAATVSPMRDDAMHNGKSVPWFEPEWSVLQSRWARNLDPPACKRAVGGRRRNFTQRGGPLTSFVNYARSWLAPYHIAVRMRWPKGLH